MRTLPQQEPHWARHRARLSRDQTRLRLRNPTSMSVYLGLLGTTPDLGLSRGLREDTTILGGETP